MSGFSTAQLRALKGKLKASQVRTRREEGIELSYIEGWFVIAEANRIFGFDGWCRETTDSRCVWQGEQGGRFSCSYTARVRVSVTAEGQTIIREGSGFGGGSGETPGEAHEMALKEAETDAMKRALTTFGNPFGLALYDPDRKGVSRPRGSTSRTPSHNSTLPQWAAALPGQQGQTLCTSPEAFYGELRKALEHITAIPQVQDLWQLNEPTLKALRQSHPDLTDHKGAHYTTVFSKLCKARIEDLQAAEAIQSETAAPQNQDHESAEVRKTQ